MLISVLPREGPKIIGGRDRYSVGDIVNVNCTSRDSKPAADLQWLVNGKPVSAYIFVCLYVCVCVC